VFNFLYICGKLCYLFILFLFVPICGRLEDKVTIQQSEVSEDGIPGNVDQFSEVHKGKHQCSGIISFGKIS
jgi:hypothetical protein